MPRRPRDIVVGSVYHLISRFVDREWFIRIEQERQSYLRLLGRSLADSDWRCLAYAIMSNHLHVEAVAGKEPLGDWVRRVHSPFADSLNKKYSRIGSVFTRGPKAYLVPPPKVGRVLAYIHNNPVRAGVVGTAGESDWTSHRAYVGLADVPAWLHVNEGLERLGIDRPAFDAWVADAALSTPRNDADAFAALELEEALVPDPARPQVDPDELVRVTARVLDVPLEELRSRRRQESHTRARRIAARCAERLGISGADTARALRISPQRVSTILIRQGCEAGDTPWLESVLRDVTSRGAS